MRRASALLLALALGCTSPPARAPPAPAGRTSAESLRARGNVILLTLDGVRWQEVFDVPGRTMAPGDTLMPTLRKLVREGVLYGDKRQGSRARIVSKKPISLPGYQAILAGGQTPCGGNDCAAPTRESLPERIARELKLPREKVAIFASWTALARAVRSDEGIVVDVREDPTTPWKNARRDAETVERAIAHLKTHQPRFLYVSLLDPDERAHRKEKAAYLDAIRAGDRSLARILDALEEMPGDYLANTSVVVTTDHGRGDGPFWSTHSRMPSARDVWIGGAGPFARPIGVATSGRVDHGQVRPTVECLLGLKPVGEPIEALVAGAGCQPSQAP